MSVNGCKVLADIKRRIQNGEDPELVIPYSVSCADHDDYIELLYYAKQVLPQGRRKQEIDQILKRETENVSRRDSEL